MIEGPRLQRIDGRVGRRFRIRSVRYLRFLSRLHSKPAEGMIVLVIIPGTDDTTKEMGIFSCNADGHQLAPEITMSVLASFGQDNNDKPEGQYL